MVAATGRKGLVELELAPPQGGLDASAPSEAALSCAAASDASSAAKVLDSVSLHLYKAA